MNAKCSKGYYSMNRFGSFITNDQFQLFLMIPVFLGALYAALRITCAGVGIHGLLHSRFRLIACIVLTVLGTGSLAYMFLSHLEYQIKNAPLNRILVWISGVYVAFFIYFLHLLAVTDILCIILRCSGHRRVPASLFMMFSVGIAVLLTFCGMMHARDIRNVHYEISSGGRLSSPMRIAVVSDLHMGSVIDTDYVQGVVNALNARQPDLVVFSGDQFNRTNAVDVVDTGEMFRILSNIEAPLGVYAVLGNHDPELNAEIYQRFLSEGGITALDNAVLEIIPGDEAQQAEVRTLVSASSEGLEPGGTPEGLESGSNPDTAAAGALFLIGRTKLAEDPERVPLMILLGQAGLMPGSGSDGRGDSGGEGTPLSRSNVSSSAFRQPEHYLLVLDHDPRGIEEAVSCDADLVLAGHTHRGQFFPATLITQLSYEKGYFYGLAQTINEITGHVTTSIVSSGAGYFQTPIRVGTDSEIVYIDIKQY